MPIRQYKPTSPGRRNASGHTFAELTKKEPEKSLTVYLEKKGRAGRNANGRITVRHRGGGHKRLYRIIDFKRALRSVDGKVVAIEYDPNRSARIALIQFPTGPRAYILPPARLSPGVA